MTAMHYWSVAQTAEQLRRKTVSVQEITEAQIKRIELINPKVNAVTSLVDEAMDVAKALDKVGRPDDAGPLWGVPVTTKINIDQTGCVNSNGVTAYAGIVADADSPVITNLKDAGAVIVGRTSTPEFSMRWFTSNPVNGVSLNPWNPELTPGGSSGAAAAAVASGIGAIAHGNDLGGSLRYPAYCCGVATIRPSLGRIPAMNPSQSAAGIERGPFTQLMAVQGPIARSIADVRAGLQVMSRRDIRDPLWVPPLDLHRDANANLTIGYAMNPFGEQIDRSVETAMQNAITAFNDAGVRLKQVDPPFATDLPALWGTLMFTESEALLREDVRAKGSAAMWRYYQEFAALFEVADATGLLQAMQRRVVCQRAWAEMFAQVDVLLMPTSLQKPFRNDQDFMEPGTLGDILAAQAPLLAINVLGLPSAALPTHLQNGSPRGVQLVGPMHQDAFVLDVAERLEREIGTLWQELERQEKV
ncbi:amidase [Thalassovita sp.]|uniref:amidase n=1 Tax=Thalassovita sp. TaxID=1979401 RepID=UPI0029DE541B|nr:amidase [Thalassovita sp.]